jgi:hypothetical protein
MALAVTHATVVATPDDGTSDVGSDEWNAAHTLTGAASPAQGGTGVANNAASTITISGAFALTATLTATTGVTFPTTGTLSTLAGSETLSNKTLTAPILGTPTSGTLTNCTGFPTASLSGLGSGVATFLATPSSANLASAVTDETGSGALVFANTPTLVTPVLGAATGTSVVLSGKLEAASIELGHASANTLTASGGVLSIEGVALLSTASVIPLTVGTTTIASGNDTRILYNNAGVLGQYTLTGSGTVVAMQTAPTFATSITTPSVLATANDSGALGASGTAFADLFLASGGVINWNAGNFTLTHSAGLLTANAAITGTTLTGTTGLAAGVASTTTGTVTIYTSGSATAGAILTTDDANTLALRNGASAQIFNIYNTYTDPATYVRMSLASTSVTLQATSGDATMYMVNSTNNSMDFYTNNAERWRITAAGHWITMGADNTYDIGASGATRPRTLYLGTMLRTPKVETPRVSELTIATGAITVTGSYHDVDTEADDATDDLATINGGTDGMRLVLRANNSGRTVVVKDGTGNIQCAGDMSLDNIQDTIELIYDGVQTAWLEVSRSDNGA